MQVRIGRRIEWKILKQELIFHKERKINKIKIENYYFDISECFNKIRV